MSIKIMQRVWERSRQARTRLLLLLALADNANDSGFCWPGTEYLARKIRATRQTVMTLTKEIEADCELIVHRQRPKSNRYIVTTGMTVDHVREGIDYLDLSGEQADALCKNFLHLLMSKVLTFNVNPFDIECKVAALHEPSRTVTEPFVSELDEFFGPRDGDRPVLPEKVNLTDPVAVAAYQKKLVTQRAERLQGEPWLQFDTLHVYTPQAGISEQALRRVHWIIRQKTGLRCLSDKAWPGWHAGLVDVFKEGAGNWKAIEAGIMAAWAYSDNYKPKTPQGFLKEVRKRLAIVEHREKQSATADQSWVGARKLIE